MRNTEQLYAQAQRQLALTKKLLSPSLPQVVHAANLAMTRVPHVSALLAKPLVSELVAVHEIASKDIAASTIEAARLFAEVEQQAQAWLRPVHAMLDDMQRGAAAVAPVMDMWKEVIAGAAGTLPTWETLAPPLPTFFLRNATNYRSSMRSVIPDLSWLSSVTDHLYSLLAWLPDLKQLKEKIKQRLFAALRSVGLCFAPSMSENLIYHLADIYQESGRRSSITLLVWNYYARRNHGRLRQMVDGWQDNPLYAQRWQSILFPAFNAHCRGEYGLSISALAPLVEGFASHVVYKNKLVPAKKPKRGQLGLGATESVILRTLKVAGDEASLESDTTEVEHWLRVKSAIAFVEDIFCQSLAFEDDYERIHRIDRQPHRHGLLHGIQANAGTALNSLRLFLLLDTMHGLLQAYHARGGVL